MILIIFFFLAMPTTCGILVPWPGIEPRAPAVEAPSPNHWTTRKFPSDNFVRQWISNYSQMYSVSWVFFLIFSFLHLDPHKMHTFALGWLVETILFNLFSLCHLRCGEGNSFTQTSLGFSLYLFIPQIFIRHLVDTVSGTWELSISKNDKDLCPYGVSIPIGGI